MGYCATHSTFADLFVHKGAQGTVGGGVFWVPKDDGNTLIILSLGISVMWHAEPQASLVSVPELIPLTT